MDDITKTGRRILICLSAAALIMIAIGSAASLYSVSTGYGMEKFFGFRLPLDTYCIAAELAAFMVTAVGMLWYIRTDRERVRKAMYLVLTVGLVFGYLFWIYNGFAYGDVNFEGALILGAPNMLALATGIVLLLPEGTKKIKTLKYVVATINAAIMTITCLGMMSLSISYVSYSGFDWTDAMVNLDFIGVSLLFIVIAVIELIGGRQYQKSADIN